MTPVDPTHRAPTPTRGLPALPGGGGGAQQLFIDSVRDYAIILLDQEGYIRSWNTGAARIKGYEADEIVGQHFSRFYPDEDVQAGRCARILDVARREGRFEDLGWRVRKDGTRFFANVVITPVVGPGGEPLGFSKVTRDLTERLGAEETLRQSEDRFRRLVDGVSDYAIFMLDPNGVVLSWNSGAQRIKGYTAGEIVGSHFSRFYPREDVIAGKCEAELAGALKDGRFEDEGWRLRKDGSRFWANVVLTALRGPDGRLEGFSKVTRDLTERRRAEETRVALAEEQVRRRDAEERARERAELVAKLEESNRQLQEAVRARDDFLTVASHELKTPLHVLGLQVSTSVFLMESGTAPLEKVKARLHKAQGEVQRLNRLITNLLDISRITANRLYLEPQDQDLVAIAREVLERDRDEIVRSGCAVSLVAPDALPGHWDKLRLDQVLTNLVSNALKYGEKGPVTITLAQVDGRARVVVKDEGLGIEEADLGRIFERFERAVSPRSHSGFGLGLWIVRQILDAMGGSIRVESQLGRGSTFTVELPLRTPAVDPT